MKRLKEESIVAWKAKGKVFFGPTKNELQYKKYRRSIYISRDIKKGDYFSKDNLKVIRPGLGLHPKEYEIVIGKKAKKNIKKGSPLKKSLIK